MGKKVYTKQEVEAIIPKARQLAAQRQGKPLQYTEQDLVNMFYNYINGYNVDPIDKEQMLSQSNIRWALDYLNQFGHNEKNLAQVVQEMYNAPSNTRARESQQRNAKNNKANRQDGYSGLGSNLWKFATGVIDLPRRAVASVIHHGTGDGRYDASQILNVMDRRPTPVTGLDYAQRHPVKAALADIGTGMASTTLASIGANTMKNAISYAGRKPLTGFEKSSALQKIQNENIPEGTAYEVIRTVNPTRGAKSGTTYQYEWGRQGGSKLTGTNNSATGRPYTRGSVVNGSKVKGQQVVNNGSTKATDEVFAWGYVPWSPFTIPGIPQFVPGLVSQTEIQQVTPHTIIEEIPGNYDDSDIINALGAQEGDVIYMPDGRIIRYIKGGTDSRGNQYDYTNVREYDRHNSDVTKQPNVPDRTRNENRKSKGKSVRTEPRKNPEYMYRDYNNYYPEIIPISNGKSGR